MNKDIQKYIANCHYVIGKKANVQSYPLQMTEIPDRPFNKIVIDLVTECKTSTSGERHILTIIDHLTDWPEAFSMPDTSADTIVLMFINHYLPVHMYPRYILLNNSTEFKNQLAEGSGSSGTQDQLYLLCTNSLLGLLLVEQWENGSISQVPKTYTQEMLCKRSNQSGQVQKPSKCQLSSSTKSCYGRDIFLVCGRDPKLPLHQLMETMQCFLGNPESGRLNLETHLLALAIAKKTLDENHFKNAQKTLERKPPSFKTRKQCILQEQATGKMGFKMETKIHDWSY